MLKSVHDPPLALYARGEFKSSDSSSVGVVGTRRPTHYGREVTERFSFTLAQAGITVVSGLALGIDTTAHRSAVRAGGRTIAVMGSGFDHVYPGSNAQLCDEIARHGVVISEFPLAKRPDKTTFPMRNRIVSGLSKAVLIVEAGQKSGALITADQALEQGRAVFAVPGRIDSPRSMGVNALIKDGARPATCPDDVLEEFETLFPAARQETQGGGQTQLDEKERQLLRILESGPTEVDSLIRHSDLDPGTVSSLLIGLEMKKKVRMLPGRTVEMR
jgi:DNA processing protein